MNNGGGDRSEVKPGEGQRDVRPLETTEKYSKDFIPVFCYPTLTMFDLVWPLCVFDFCFLFLSMIFFRYTVYIVYKPCFRDFFILFFYFISLGGESLWKYWRHCTLMRQGFWSVRYKIGNFIIYISWSNSFHYICSYFPFQPVFFSTPFELIAIFPARPPGLH